VNHYHALGVSVSATTTAIRAAYRRLALALHPDRAGAEFTSAFQKIAAAYEVLSDPVKRARYDDALAHRQGRARPSASGRATGSREVLARISGPLRSLIASGILTRIDDESYALRLTKDEADRGGFVVISTPAPNQFTHWITIPAGSVDGEAVTSVVRAGEWRSVLQLRIRVTR